MRRRPLRRPPSPPTSSATASTKRSCGRTSSASAAARVARHPHPAADGGDRAPLEDQHPARRLRADPPVHAVRPAGQHRRQVRRGRLVPGARGIKFYKHPGAHLNKKPGRWIVAAELVETTRLFGRGIAAIEPQWIEQIGGHLLKKQLLDPHWEKKAAQVSALERATLYGIVIYSNRRVNFGKVDPHAAREIFIRKRWWAGSGRRACRSWRPTRSSSPRWRNWSTSRAARTCWWTKS